MVSGPRSRRGGWSRRCARTPSSCRRCTGPTAPPSSPVTSRSPAGRPRHSFLRAALLYNLWTTQHIYKRAVCGRERRGAAASARSTASCSTSAMTRPASAPARPAPAPCSLVKFRKLSRRKSRILNRGPPRGYRKMMILLFLNLSLVLTFFYNAGADHHSKFDNFAGRVFEISREYTEATRPLPLLIQLLLKRPSCGQFPPVVMWSSSKSVVVLFLWSSHLHVLSASALLPL